MFEQYCAVGLDKELGFPSSYLVDDICDDYELDYVGSAYKTNIIPDKNNDLFEMVSSGQQLQRSPVDNLANGGLNLQTETDATTKIATKLLASDEKEKPAEKSIQSEVDFHNAANKYDGLASVQNAAAQVIRFCLGGLPHPISDADFISLDDNLLSMFKITFVNPCPALLNMCEKIGLEQTILKMMTKLVDPTITDEIDVMICVEEAMEFLNAFRIVTEECKAEAELLSVWFEEHCQRYN